MTSLIACQPPPKDCSHTVLKKEGRVWGGGRQGRSICGRMQGHVPPPTHTHPPHSFSAAPAAIPPHTHPRPLHHTAIPPLTPSIYLPRWSADTVANSLCALLPETQTGQGALYWRCIASTVFFFFFPWYKQIVCQNSAGDTGWGVEFVFFLFFFLMINC